jgi:amino acid permease
VNNAIDIQKGTVEICESGIIIEDGLRRGLEGRHVTLISLASVIGASCFYGFGYALYLSGPLGSLVGFGIVGQLLKFDSSRRGVDRRVSEKDLIG